MQARYFSFLVLTTFALATPARPAVIYSQTTPAEPVAAFSSLDITGFYKVADNFSFAGNAMRTVRSLRFVGAPTNTSADELSLKNMFRVAFLEDADGVPGELLAGGDFHVGDAVTKIPTGGPSLGAPVFPVEYRVDLGQGISLNPDVVYWLTITNDLRPDRGWLWARANGDLDNSIASTSGDIGLGPWAISTSPGGMYFELNSQNIPEPGTAVLALLVIWCWIGIGKTTR